MMKEMGHLERRITQAITELGKAVLTREDGITQALQRSDSPIRAELRKAAKGWLEFNASPLIFKDEISTLNKILIE